MANTTEIVFRAEFLHVELAKIQQPITLVATDQIADDHEPTLAKY